MSDGVIQLSVSMIISPSSLLVIVLKLCKEINSGVYKYFVINKRSRKPADEVKPLSTNWMSPLLLRIKKLGTAVIP